jgi:hypothetical protein
MICIQSIEHHHLPYIDVVIKDYNQMFVHQNVAHKLCKGHIDDISVLLLFDHFKLVLLKEDQDAVILG